jgi:hypothetical protein
LFPKHETFAALFIVDIEYLNNLYDEYQNDVETKEVIKQPLNELQRAYQLPMSCLTTYK